MPLDDFYGFADLIEEHYKAANNPQQTPMTDTGPKPIGSVIPRA